MDWIVDNAGQFSGVDRSACPEIHATIVEASPLFLAAFKQVLETGMPIHFKEMEMTTGKYKLGSGPAVMYRSDNPAEPIKE